MNLVAVLAVEQQLQERRRRTVAEGEGQGRQHAGDAVEGVADEAAGGDGRRQRRKRREVRWGMIRCAAYAWEEE